MGICITEELRSMLVSSLDGFLLIDADGQILEANDNYCQLIGYSHDQLLNMHISSLHSIDCREDSATQVKTIIKTGSARFTTRHLSKNNSIINVEISANYSSFHGGTIFSFIRDITQAEEQLRHRAQTESELLKHYQVVEQSPATITITDLDGNLEYVNPAFCTLTGYTLIEVLGKNQRFLKSGVTTAEEYRVLWETITRGGIWYGEFCNKKKNGDYYWERACIAPIIDKEGAIKHFVAIKEDISKQKKHESEKLTLEAQLRQAMKMESVGRLAGGVAHDFNNILMIIKNFTFLSLLETDPSQQTFTFLNEINKATERAIGLTRQLLAFARKQTIAPKVINMNETVAGMLQMLQRLIGEDIQVTWQPAAKLWPVKLDPSQIDQILANLCVNARDAISDNGTIMITTENHRFDERYCSEHTYAKPGDYVLLTVSDNGCGMNNETVTHIFEPFFTTKDVGKGTGLGLATVYGIVKQNDGVIEVDSELNVGTTFRIYLPRYKDEGQIAHNGSAEEASPRGHEIILLVEDDADILRSTARMLEHVGYTVISAHNHDEAIRLARENDGNFQLLITDVVMPGMNGRELNDNLKLLYPQLKCLFMSGYTADIIASHGVLDNGVHFIQKPFSLPEIAAKVRDLLDNNSY